MLPAIERDFVPRNLILPDRRTYYSMAVTNDESYADIPRRGSMAGRAVLRAVGMSFPKEIGRA